MAKKASLYARALSESLDKAAERKVEQVLARFKHLVKKRGDLKLLSSVLKEFERYWEERNGKLAHVVSAQKPSLVFIESMRKILHKQGYAIKEEKNEQLIGGTAVFLGNEYLVDSSIQGKLNKLRSLLKA